MELHLFRHGETNWNKEGRAQSHNGSKLTNLGINQAQIVRDKIRNIEFDCIYSSSSRRAKQTAELIWPQRVTEILYSYSLREIELGPWEGQLYQDIKLTDPTSHRHFFFEPHLFSLKGAETFQNLTERSVKFVHEIFDNNRAEVVAVVSHGAFLKALFTKLEQKGLSEIWEPPFMHNCAHNIIKFTKSGSAKIIQYADKSKW